MTMVVIVMIIKVMMLTMVVIVMIIEVMVMTLVVIVMIIKVMVMVTTTRLHHLQTWKGPQEKP